MQRADRLLNLETKHGQAIADLQVQMDALRDRVTRLEAREDIVVAEAKGAAAAAATGAAATMMADMSRRVGVMEGKDHPVAGTPKRKVLPKAPAAKPSAKSLRKKPKAKA
jgi:hypothetical protein